MNSHSNVPHALDLRRDTTDTETMWIPLAITAALAVPPLPAHTAGRESLELARQLLPEAHPHRTSRYVVLSDGDRELIRSVEHALEEARRQYDRWCRTMRLPRAKPEDRLLCILFHNRSDFISFAEQTEGLGETAALVSGYFSPRFEWIACFDPEDSADMAAAATMLADADADIQSAEDRGANPEQIDDARQRIDNARAEMLREERARRTAVTIHEAIHQLVHIGEAFPGRRAWPGWLHEGVAVAFETDNHRTPFGPDRNYPTRADGFREAIEAGHHIPLETLLAEQTIDHTDGHHVGVLYDQAGSLISWLYRHKRRELATFLQQAGVPDSTGLTPDLTTLFTETFGSPTKIERRWLADVSQ